MSLDAAQDHDRASLYVDRFAGAVSIRLEWRRASRPRARGARCGFRSAVAAGETPASTGFFAGGLVRSRVELHLPRAAALAARHGAGERLVMRIEQQREAVV